MTAVRRRMARADSQRCPVGEPQHHDAMAAGDGLSVHQPDRNDGKRSVIDAVDEVADLQISNRPIAGGRRDRRRRRGAIASRAAGRACPIDGFEAAGDIRTERHRATDLRAGAASSPAAGRAGVAGRADERTRPTGLAGSVRAIRVSAAARGAAGSAVEDVVAGVDAETAAALESLAVGVALTRLPATRPRRAATGPAAPSRSAAGRSARSGPSRRPTAGASTRRRTESRRDVHAARTFRRPTTDVLDAADLSAARSDDSGRTAGTASATAALSAGATATCSSTGATGAGRSTSTAASAVRSAGSAAGARPAIASPSTASLRARTAVGSATAAATAPIGSTRLNRSAGAQCESSDHDHHTRDELHRDPLPSQMNRCRR